MRHLALILALCAAPALAEEGDAEEGLGLIDRGMEMLLDEFMDRMDPAIEEFRDRMDPALEEFRDRVGPALEDLRDQLQALGDYHPPEMLPNGDIIIRRKTPLEPMLESNPDGSVDL